MYCNSKNNSSKDIYFHCWDKYKVNLDLQLQNYIFMSMRKHIHFL
jgi:hypothetical protein